MNKKINFNYLQTDPEYLLNRVYDDIKELIRNCSSDVEKLVYLTDTKINFENCYLITKNPLLKNVIKFIVNEIKRIEKINSIRLNQQFIQPLPVCNFTCNLNNVDIIELSYGLIVSNNVENIKKWDFTKHVSTMLGNPLNDEQIRSARDGLKTRYCEKGRNHEETSLLKIMIERLNNNLN